MHSMPHAYSSSCVPSQEDGREGPQPPHIQTTHGADSLPPPPPLPNGRRRRRILPCRRGPRRCGSRSRSRSRSRRRRRSGSGSGRLLPRGGLRPASRLCRLRRPGPRPFCRGAGADADAGAGAGPGEGGRCPLGFRIFRTSSDSDSSSDSGPHRRLESAYPPDLPALLRGEAVRSALRSPGGICLDLTAVVRTAADGGSDPTPSPSPSPPLPPPLSVDAVRLSGRAEDLASFLNGRLSSSFPPPPTSGAKAGHPARERRKRRRRTW